MNSGLRLSLVALLCVLTMAIVAPSAAATLADTLQADLRHPASGVPDAQVTVGAPVGEELALGTSETVMRVTMRPSPGEALAGVLTPPGAKPLFTTTMPKLVFWDFAVLQAAKHALAGGAQLDAISITHNFVGEPPSPTPTVIERLEGFVSPPAPPVVMSLSELKSRVRNALPEWATGSSITIAEDYAGERVVSVNAQLPRAAFRVVSVPSLFRTLARQQAALAPEGARIGRVFLEISDPTNNQPLLAAAADPSFGAALSWSSPLVRMLVGQLGTGGDVLTDPKDAVDDATADYTGPLAAAKGPIDQQYEELAGTLGAALGTARAVIFGALPPS